MQLSKYSLRILSLGLCLGLATSCAKRENTDTTLSNDTTVTTSDSHMTGDSAAHNTTGNAMNGGSDNAMNMSAMSDGNIMAWMGMADSMEIAMANMAKTKAQHAEVKKFAQMMSTEHAKMKKEGQALAQKQNITPVAPSPEMMTYDMMTQHSDIQSATGHAFDSLYIASQVAMHQHVLDNLNKVNPQNAELKAAIDKAKPHVQHHLDEAKRIQGALTSTK